jgi:hypothetical protein
LERTFQRISGFASKEVMGIGGWSLWEVLASGARLLWGDWECSRGWNTLRDHLVDTSNLSLTVLTLQHLAPCFFRSVSQSSNVSKRGIGGFLELEPWPGTGVTHRRRKKRNQRQLFSSFVFSQPLLSQTPLPFPYPHSMLTHQPCSVLSLHTDGFDCFELWLGQWPWLPV